MMNVLPTLSPRDRRNTFRSTRLYSFDFVSEGSKSGKPGKVALVGSYDGDSLPSGAHGDEGIVGQASLSNLLVIVLDGKPGQHFASL